MNTTTERLGTPDPHPPPRSRRWPLAVAAIAVVALAAIGFGVYLLPWDDTVDLTNARVSEAEAVGQLERSCQEWVDAQPSDVRARHDGWCGHVSGWMHREIESGHMRGHGMWQSPTAMHQTCRQAVQAYEHRPDDPGEWCRDMVGWMAERGHHWEGGGRSPRQ